MAGTSLHHSTDPCTNGKHSGHPTVPSTPSAIGTRGGVDGIPVVDFDVLVNGAADQRAQAIRDLGRACEDWGFFMVINHGVPEELKDAMMETCKELFSLPEEEKAEYLEGGPMDPIRIGTGFFSVVDGVRYWRDYLKMFVHPELHCPAKPAKLRYWTTGTSANHFVALCLCACLPWHHPHICKDLCDRVRVVCQGRRCRVLGEDEKRAAVAGEGDLRELGSRQRPHFGGHGPGLLLADPRREPLPAVHRPGRCGHGPARALRPRPAHHALPERRRRAPGRARRAVAPRQAPPRRVLRHRRRPAGDREQREIQGRAPPRGGRRRAREDVHSEHDLAVPGHPGRAGPGAGTRGPGPRVPGRQVPGLHGASAEQQAPRESGAGHRPGAARDLTSQGLRTEIPLC